MYSTIIRQLEKALECEDAELRIRVEVLLDLVKEQAQPAFPQPVQPSLPQASFPQPVEKLKLEPQELPRQSPRIQGAGAIISNNEQISYKRPEGT